MMSFFITLLSFLIFRLTPSFSPSKPGSKQQKK